MNVIKAFYRQEDGNAGVLLANLDDVRKLIEELHAESIQYDVPLLTQWYIANEVDTPELGIGVHHDHGVLYYTGNDWPGPWYSDGDETLGDSEIDYDYMGNATPFQMDNHVPYDVVLRAAEQFFESRGARPTAVEWRKYT
ncbi:MAG: Imm1 family immunity protein [Chloroflexota bacterium]|nr:Imm1 family immunity protein [Chloroflexota bacterium]